MGVSADLADSPLPGNISGAGGGRSLVDCPEGSGHRAAVENPIF